MRASCTWALGGAPTPVEEKATNETGQCHGKFRRHKVNKEEKKFFFFKQMLRNLLENSLL